MSVFPKYDSYKDCGVEWIGEMPDHWSVTRNLGLFDERKEINRPDMELLSVTIERGVIKQEEITAKKDSSNEDKSKYKVVRQGDLAYNKMRMWQGAIGMSEYDGIVSPAYIILNTRDKAYSRYFHYLYRTEMFIKEANRHSYGLCSDMNSLRYEDFKTIYSPLPPPTDVERIVSFLYQKTAEIDAAIAKKQHLIELLKEQKAILINQAVTKGLNPNATMRDSGVEWIGQIPAHWMMPPMYTRFRVELGKMLDAKRISGRHLVPYLRNTDVQWGMINVDDLPEMDIHPSELQRFTVKNNDLLVCEGGEIGRCAIYRGTEEILGFQKALHRVRPFDGKRENIYYLYFVMMSAAHHGAFQLTAKTNTIAHLTGEMFRAYRFPQPSRREQDQIAEHLAALEEESGHAIKLEQVAIERLVEWKTVLTANTVTGRIKI